MLGNLLSYPFKPLFGRLRTRVGTLDLLLVLQDREGTFSTQLFGCYQSNEKALVLILMETYVEGVSTPKVKEIT
jgi:transposase-like protein